MDILAEAADGMDWRLVWLIIGAYGAIIGQFGMIAKSNADVNKKIAQIYECIYAHLQNSAIHQKNADYVRNDLCIERHTNLEKKIDDMSLDVKKLLDRK